MAEHKKCCGGACGDDQALVEVCEGKTCGSRFSREIMTALGAYFGLQEQCNERICVRYRGCTGYCEEANNVVVNGNIISHVAPDTAAEHVEQALTLPPGDHTKGEFKDLELDEEHWLGLQ